MLRHSGDSGDSPLPFTMLSRTRAIAITRTRENAQLRELTHALSCSCAPSIPPDLPRSQNSALVRSFAPIHQPATDSEPRAFLLRNPTLLRSNNFASQTQTLFTLPRYYDPFFSKPLTPTLSALNAHAHPRYRALALPRSCAAALLRIWPLAIQRFSSLLLLIANTPACTPAPELPRPCRPAPSRYHATAVPHYPDHCFRDYALL